jgi:hypothetical protein
MNEVFTIREGEWQVRLGSEVLPTIWNSKGAAAAGMKTEIRRRNRGASQELEDVQARCAPGQSVRYQIMKSEAG